MVCSLIVKFYGSLKLVLIFKLLDYDTFSKMITFPYLDVGIYPAQLKSNAKTAFHQKVPAVSLNACAEFYSANCTSSRR